MSWDSILIIVSSVGFLVIAIVIKRVWERGDEETPSDPHIRDVRLPPIG